MLMEALLLHGEVCRMNKKLLFALMLILLTGSVLAISFFGDTSFKGFAITNVSMVVFSDGTNMSTAATGSAFDGNMSGGNLTSVECVVFESGGSICTG